MKQFKWTIEIVVDETWVADGFDLTDDVAKEMVMQTLNWARPDEIAAKVVKSPNPEKIQKARYYW